MSSHNPSKPVTHLMNGPGAERQLVEGLLRGEESCYRQLYEVFAPRLRALLQRIFRDPALVRGLIIGALRHALAGAGHRASTTVAGAALNGFRPGGAADRGKRQSDDCKQCLYWQQ